MGFQSGYDGLSYIGICRVEGVTCIQPIGICRGSEGEANGKDKG